MIIALAGRRVDAIDAKEPRFPLKNVDLVRKRIRAMFESHQEGLLVCAAACGADLVALTQAGALGWRRRVVLPFSRKRFRESSVTDRPGDWGPVYDRVLDDVEKSGDLVIMSPVPDDQAWALANIAILNEAAQFAAQFDDAVTAVLVWDGISRGQGDVTQSFGVEARKRGLPVREVPTI